MPNPVQEDAPPPSVVVVAGPAGSGKSTIASELAQRLGWALLDADSLHTPEAIARIAAGEPLTDADRAPWLARVAAWIDAGLAAGQPAVVACSALRRTYRVVLARPGLAFALLDVDRAELAARLAARRDHFAGPALLDSQLATLEPLQPGETGIAVDGGQPAGTVAETVIAALKLNG